MNRSCDDPRRFDTGTRTSSLSQISDSVSLSLSLSLSLLFASTRPIPGRSADEPLRGTIRRQKRTAGHQAIAGCFALSAPSSSMSMSSSSSCCCSQHNYHVGFFWLLAFGFISRLLPVSPGGVFGGRALVGGGWPICELGKCTKAYSQDSAPETFLDPRSTPHAHTSPSPTPTRHATLARAISLDYSEIRKGRGRPWRG